MDTRQQRYRYETLLGLVLTLGCTGSSIITPQPGEVTGDAALGEHPKLDAGLSDLGASPDAQASPDVTPLPDAAPPSDLGPRDAASDAAPTDAGGTRWTIFVYGHGDHNLSPSLENDIIKMSMGTYGPNVQVVVAADFDASRTSQRTMAAYPAGTHWVRIRPGMAPEELSVEPEQNLDDPAVLTASVRRAFMAYPADRYGVVMWDHGGGWRGGFGGDTQNGTAQGAGGMSAPRAAEAITAALTSLGMTGARPLEFMAFDTCLMAAPEVLRPFRDVAKVFFGAAEIDYGAGWNYAATLTYIGQHPDAPIRDIAAQEVRDWDALHGTMGVLDQELRAHVAIDLTRFEAFSDAMGALSVAMLSPGMLPLVNPARHGYLAVPAYGLNFERNLPSPDYRDVGQFLGSLGAMPSAPSVGAAAMSARSALNAMIIGSSLGRLRAAVGQSGVHIALPWPAAFDAATATAYSDRASEWAHDSQWGEVLTAMRPGSVAAPNIMAGSIANGRSPTAAALPRVSLMAMGDVVEGVSDVYSVIQTDAGAPLFVAREPADRQPLVAGRSASFTWDAHVLVMAAPGGGAQPITVRSYLRGGNDAMGRPAASFYTIPGVCAFSAPTEAVACNLLFQDGPSARVLALLTEENEREAAHSIQQIAAAFPRATFTPTLLVEDAAGTPLVSLTGAPVPMPTDGTLPIGRIAAPAGDYLMLTRAFDVYGRFAARVDPVVITTPVTP